MMPPGETSADRPVLRLGRYALHDVIASGGMATVHLGRLRDPVGFSRTVAIKRLHQQFAANAEFVNMFLDEARLAGRVRHPNVVSTLDVVATDGELFIVMEYIPGEALSRIAATMYETRQFVPPRIISSILSSALHGLHAAHEAKNERGEALDIVHRDVSPQNILVGTDGVVRVLDFGIAKAIGRSQETRTGTLKGKLSYMPPEQVSGGHVTRQTDVYAAGVVLWELIAGVRLFSGESEVAIINKVLHAEVASPTEVCQSPERSRTLEELAALEVLTPIVMCALSRDPSERFPTARAMALAIERSVEPAIPSEIGEWLERIDAQRLTQRARLVADIESSETTLPAGLFGAPEAPVASVTPVAPSAPSDSLPRDLTPLAAKSGLERPRRDSQSTAAPVVGLATASKHRVPLWIPVVLGVALISVTAVAAWRSQAGSRGRVADPPAVLASTPPSVASYAPLALEPIPSATSDETVDNRAPPPPPQPSSLPTPSRPPAHPPPVVRPTVTPAPTASAPNACFYWENGIKHVDPKCL
jgi:serine/threonine-protein kinase